MISKKWTNRNPKMPKQIQVALIVHLLLSSAHAAQTDPYQEINTGWDRLGAVLTPVSYTHLTLPTILRV